MPDYDYLIVGGGMTADSAIRGIREVDDAGSIGYVSAEPHAPYDRPPLSKSLWKGEPEETVWRDELPDGVTAHLDRRVKTLDRANHRATDHRGTTYGYRKLLLATGGSPRMLGPEHERVFHFRTLDDYRNLRGLLRFPSHVIVIGTGFMGCEMAAGLTIAGHRVTLVGPEAGLGARVFPESLALALAEYFREKGVDVLTSDRANAVSAGSLSVSMRTESGRSLEAAAVVIGIGIVPAVGLAQAAGLAVDRGIVVNEQLQTRDPDVYSAGDVARFPNPALGTAIRVEHEDNANHMGRAAGRNMAGADEPYTYLPMFYSDLFDLGYEAVGDLDPRYETVEDWKEFAREGVVYYLADGRVRGVLLWNVWGQVDAARALIAEPGPFQAKQLMGRIVG